jgi:glutathione S-transferase
VRRWGWRPCLARHHGRGDGSDLAPASPAEDAEALRWAFWAMTELEADALTVLMHRRGLPPERRDADRLTAAEQCVRGPLAVLEAHLQVQAHRGWPHLAAERFTVADVCVASVANWVRSSPELMHAFPHVHEWLQRCHARPAYRALKEKEAAHKSSATG